MKTSEENVDIMLFDYLEGNLSSNEVKQVERQIASDPLIKEELNIWKESYIQADHYPTTVVLESQLLQSTGSFSFTLFLNSILVVCLTLISSTNPELEPFSTSPISHQSLPALVSKMPPSQIVYQQVIIEPKQVLVTSSTTPNDKVHYEAVQNAELVYQTFPELVKLNPGWFHYPEKHPESMNVVYVKTTKPTTKTALRKKEREIRKWKKKAARERMAAEFIKGDIPYVVPVNPNNF